MVPESVLLRVIDILIAFTGIVLFIPLSVVVFILAFVETGSAIFFQVRVGQNQRPFTLIKFRTMKRETLSVATHLVDPQAVTLIGSFLRQSKLDELPQLWNVFKGEMSLVGPRPCLFSQEELIGERERLGVFAVRPGIIGLAQIRGIDMSTPQLLAETEQICSLHLGYGSIFSICGGRFWVKGVGTGLRRNRVNLSVS